jgi:signal transduction histidine kinase/ActR/RegA family two-component response regulator
VKAWSFYRASVRGRLMAVVLISTIAALLVTGTAMLVYDLHTYEQTWVSDLTTQADLLARSSGAALAFHDPQTAQDNLGALRIRPKVSAAAIYGLNGHLFAQYRRNATVKKIPGTPSDDGHWIEGRSLNLFYPISANGERLGTIYLRADYELLNRLTDYLSILLAVLLGSAIIAFLLARRLQRSITEPIFAVTNVARRVMEERNFSFRAQKTTEDELGYLVDAFNDMLAEVGQRARALEQTNRALQYEMTERLEAEEALRVAGRHKDEFLAILAHELRNPLAPLRNWLQILRISADKPAMVAQAGDVMERQLQQMVRLVDDLLDVSRITTGKLRLKKKQTTLSNVVSNAVEAVRPFLQAREHLLTLSMPETETILFVDGARLAQVFANLLHNAAKFSDPGSPIEFTAAVKAGSLRVDVIDHGIGQAPESIAPIFEMFTQADKSLERSQAGLGVGLALAKRLVGLHGGSIEAESAGDGAGSRFCIVLPIGSCPPDEQTPGDRQEGIDASRTLRILLADDNMDFAESMAALLRMQSHELRIAYDGETALTLAQGFLPDIAFLDIGMPKLNGYEVAKRIRGCAALAATVLVAVTGWGQLKDKESAIAAGFDFHLVKPVDFEAIQALLAPLRAPKHDAAKRAL